MNDRVFKKTPDGNLSFVGDFENLYLEMEDPWGQTLNGHDQAMNEFYRLSRKTWFKTIANIASEDSIICELGCGLGHSTKQLKDVVRCGRILGVDISETAIHKARKYSPDLEFYQENILVAPLKVKSDILILSNMLWYVLHDLESLKNNLLASFRDSPGRRTLVVQNALFKSDQKYGNHLVSSIGTMVDLVYNLFSDVKGELSCKSEFYKFSEAKHDFGLVLIGF